MNCIECKNLIDNQVSHKIPGGIRGCGTPHTYFFCSQGCVETFKKTKQCQVCKCTEYEQEFIDGYAVCTDTSSWMEVPTCKQKYTGNFICDYCEENKKGLMYTINNDSKLYESELGLDDGEQHCEYRDILVMCESCFNPYKINSYFFRPKNMEIPYPNIYEIFSDYPNHKYLVFKYKEKINPFNMSNTKQTINKLFRNNKMDELNELYSFISELLNKTDS